MEFGERLRILRTNRGLTQADVANKVGVSRRTYVSYEQQGKHPRKREMYSKLADALGCDVNDLLVEDTAPSAAGAELISSIPSLTGQTGKFVGLAALAAVAGAPLASVGVLGAIPSVLVAMTAGKMLADSMAEGNDSTSKPSEAEAAPITYAREAFQQLVRERRQFAATARGLIYTALAERGITFTPSQNDKDSATAGPEEIISLHHDYFDEWWLVYEPSEKNQGQDDASTQDIHASMLLARFYDYSPNPRRKVSVVVDNDELFSALLRKRDNNSYRGNLSAILIDRDEVSIACESYLATYEYGADVSALMHVAEEHM